MRRGLKKALAVVLMVVLLMGAFSTAVMETVQNDTESEVTLRERLADAAPDAEIVFFFNDDYDGDGQQEAFALLDDTVAEKLWFVSPSYCTSIQSGKSYRSLGKFDRGASILLATEIDEGENGVANDFWIVMGGVPFNVDLNNYEGYSYNGNGEFEKESIAPDGNVQKPYYFTLDKLEMVELGGIYITRSQLEELEGASEILKNEENNGNEIKDIIYRRNGVININLYNGDSYENMTLRFDARETGVQDTGVRYGGLYDLLSGETENVIYPDSFPMDKAAIGKEVESESDTNNQIRVAAVDDSQSDKAERFKQFREQNSELKTPATAEPVSQAQVSEQDNSQQTGAYVRATGDVKVRSAPSKNAEELGVLHEGQRALYAGETRKDDRQVEWYKISMNGRTGWVSSKYAIVENRASTSSGSSLSGSGSNKSATSGQSVAISGGKCNIRTGPGLNYDTIGSLKAGRVVRYLGKSQKDNRGVTWYYIEFEGEKGWVSSKYGYLR